MLSIVMVRVRYRVGARLSLVMIRQVKVALGHGIKGGCPALPEG
jgi:hypothetical protein